MLAFACATACPWALKWREGRRLAERLKAFSGSNEDGAIGSRSSLLASFTQADPALLVRVGEISPMLASWQTIGGCGAVAGAGAGAGVKWIGRNVTGGLFNVQEQVLYTKLGTSANPEHSFFFNTLVTTDIGEKWNAGVNVPLIYKYLINPNPVDPPVDWSNAGLGDVSLQLTRRLGRINALTLTGIVGLPTGTYDATYTPTAKILNVINQTSQLGFGRPTGTLILDQTLDRVWGVLVFGGVASYRGGKNKFYSYRAPSLTGYGYAGYFWGPFVPAFGLSLTGFDGHDLDKNAQQNTPLLALAANISIEWSTEYFAVLLAGSIPYKWDGVHQDDMGLPRTPWGWAPWTVALGIATAPF